MTEASWLEKILTIIPLVLAVVIHEVSHGVVALRLGDPTAKNLGRLTLNPVKHVSLMGTILVPLMLYLIKAPFLFGWAKPVPINPSYFRRPIKDMAWVAAAGPISNAAQALVFAGIFRFLHIFAGATPGRFLEILLNLCVTAVVINLGLGFFNLIPIPPLDGGRIMAALLPSSWVKSYAQLERVGLLLVIALIYLNVLRWVMIPIALCAYVLLGESVFQ